MNNHSASLITKTTTGRILDPDLGLLQKQVLRYRISYLVALYQNKETSFPCTLFFLCQKKNLTINITTRTNTNFKYIDFHHRYKNKYTCSYFYRHYKLKHYLKLNILFVTEAFFVFFAFILAKIQGQKSWTFSLEVKGSWHWTWTITHYIQIYWLQMGVFWQEMKSQNNSHQMLT